MAAIAFARGALEPLISAAATQIGRALVIACAALTSTALLVPGARLRGISGIERALPAAPLVALVSAFLYASLRVQPGMAELAHFSWLVGAVLAAGLQGGALLARAARRAENERSALAALIESLPFGVALCDSEGSLEHANGAFAKIAGIAELDAARGCALRASVDTGWLCTNGAPGSVAWLPQPGETQRKTEWKHRDGRIGELEVHDVRGDAGRKLSTLWLLRDVSRDRALQAELVRARELEKTARLAGGIAHEFNNQLTSVIGNLDLLRNELPGSGNGTREIAEAEMAAQRCADLTRDLLDFARVAPRLPRQVEVMAQLRTLIERLKKRLPSGVGVSLDVADAAGRVEADPRQFERALWILLENAAEAVEGRGRIAVSAHRCGTANADRIEIAVEDDGRGMDAALQERAFDPFFSTKEVGPASGLGLAIVDGIAAAHGGRVRVASTPGRGSLFAITWPAARE
jgi:signal transduction histidine kinase